MSTYIPIGDDWQVNAVTPWFSGRVKPVRPGIYERGIAHGRSLGFSRWDGAIWYMLGITPDNAELKQEPSGCQQTWWRGLAQDPKGKP